MKRAITKRRASLTGRTLSTKRNFVLEIEGAQLMTPEDHEAVRRFRLENPDTEFAVIVAGSGICQSAAKLREAEKVSQKVQRLASEQGKQ